MAFGLSLFVLLVSLLFAMLLARTILSLIVHVCRPIPNNVRTAI